MYFEERRNNMSVDSKKIFNLISILNKNAYYHPIIENMNIPITLENAENIYRNLPIINRERLNAPGYVSFNGDNIKEELTSGTFGIPIKCYKNEKEIRYLNCNLWRERKKWDPEVRVNNFFNMYGNYTYKSIGNFFDLEKNNMIRCFNEMIKLKPRWLSGSATALTLYAKLIEDGEIENKSIRFIELSGEFVKDKNRQYIEKMFNCKTINHYGLRECWCVAYECRCGHMHCLSDFDVFTKNDNLVVTNTKLETMPIVKYDTGDKAKIFPSSCDNDNSIIVLSEGREGQVLFGKKNMIGDIFFKRVFNKAILNGFDYAMCYQAIQKSKTDIEINIKLNKTYKTVELSEYKNFIISVISDWLDNEDVNIILNFNRLRLSTTGKNIAFINEYQNKSNI